MDSKPKNKFIHLESFLKQQDIFLSILDLDNNNLKLTPKYFEDKCELLFNYSKVSNNVENITDAIYLTKAGYYVYLSRTPEFDETYDVKILYDSTTKKSEVLLFIKTINKKTNI